MINDIIVALATPNMKSAISIIRLSGSGCIELVNDIFSKDLTKVNANTINYGYIIKDGKKYDEVLVSVFKAPKSYTTEDVVEINTHGGIAITREILNLVLSKGVRMAQPGEFTLRAYLNNRIDLLEAEAINEMIEAKSEKATKIAMSGLTRKTTELVENFKEELLQIIAIIEVNIDYPEYDDVKELSNQEVKDHLFKFKESIIEILKNSKTSNYIKNGIKVAIIGQPNAGKSSLLNAFLETDKAIVTDIEGTTRDIVEAEYVLNGVNLIFLDTAGIRETQDLIETIGIEKTKKSIKEADLILLVVDASKNKLSLYEKQLIDEYDNLIVVLNKSDLRQEISIPGIKVSALNKDIESLKNEISKRLDLDLDIDNERLFLSNQRHLSLLNKVNQSIDSAINQINMQMPSDLVVSDLEDAYYLLQEVLNENYDDSLLDELFSRFCLGK